jgi:hypothetical protein
MPAIANFSMIDQPQGVVVSPVSFGTATMYKARLKKAGRLK